MRRTSTAIDHAVTRRLGVDGLWSFQGSSTSSTASLLARAIAVSALALAALVMLAGSAHAYKQVDHAFGGTSSTPALGGTFNFGPFSGVAVRQSTGQVYVVDRNNNRVQRFGVDTKGTPSLEDDTYVFERAWGWDVVQTGGTGDDADGTPNEFEICTVASQCKVGVAGSGAGQLASAQGQGIAVDQGSGVVYVTDSVNRRVLKFDADGNFLLAFGGRDIVASGPGNADERQVVKVDATAGTFTLTFSGQTTAAIPFDSTAAAVQTALEDLSNLAPGDVTVTGGPGGAGGTTPYVVAFGGAQANVNLAPMTASGAGLTGTVTVGTATDGGVGAEICVPSNGDVCKAGSTGGLAGEFGTNANSIAVDAAGNVYVGEGTQRRIQKFDSAGNALRAWGWDVVVTGWPGNVGTAAYEICVPASGAICKGASTASGTALGQFGSTTVLHMAADSTNRLYVVDGNSRVQRFQADGTSPELFGAAELSGSPAPVEIAIDRTDDHVYVVKPSTSPSERQIKELLPDGALVPDGTHALNEGITSTNGMALHESTGRLFFTSQQGGHRVLVLDDDGGAEPGEVLIQPASDVGPHSATLHAVVDPNGFETTYRFEYSRDGVNWTPVGSFESAGGGDGPVPVSVSVSDLQANSLYRFRVQVVTLFAGAATSAEQTFATDTVPPEVTTGSAQRVTSGSAQARGRINPNNLPTTYWVEYGKTTSYGNRAPVPDASAGSGGVEKLFLVDLTDLESDQLYHFRFGATNAQGTIYGSDATFTTRPSLSPGDDRAYEMVTPPEKAARSIGGHTRFETPNVGVPSSDGESLQFTLTYVLMDPDAGVAIPHFSVPTRISRGSDGWDGEALDNLLPKDPAVAGIGGNAGMSEDLTVQAWERAESPFESLSRLGTRVFGDAGGLNGSGWYDWVPDEDKAAALSDADQALITENGGRMVRWGPEYRGLLEDAGTPGVEDPSSTQLADDAGGAAIYSQAPAGTGPIHLVNECTGAGAGSTTVPAIDDQGTGPGGPQAVATSATATVGSNEITVDTMAPGSPPFTVGQVLHPASPVAGAFPASTIITAVSGSTLTVSNNATSSTTGLLAAIPNPNAGDDDKVVEQACEAGSVTSLRGAVVGGGGSYNRPVGGPTVRAMSEAGDRVFFLSPDPDAVGVPTACSGVDSGTDCPPQLYVRQYGDGGAATVRWISRSSVASQHPNLMGRGIGFEGASADGSVVYFRTNAPLTEDDPNGGAQTPGGVKTGTASDSSWDLFRYELPQDTNDDPAGGTLTRISGGPNGGTSDPNVLNAALDAPGTALRFLSDDGQKAYFVTRGIIGSPGDPMNDSPDGGVTAPDVDPGGAGATRNLYLYDAEKPADERWSFVARLPYTQFGSLVDNCASSGGKSGMPGGDDDGVRSQRVNCVHGLPSGEAIAFETKGRLTGDDEDSAGDIYLYDAEVDSLTRVSAPPIEDPGYVCGSIEEASPERCNASFGKAPTGADYERVGLAGASHQNFAFYDGELSLFFESSLPLSPEDENGSRFDVYEWRNGDVTLISPGTSDDHARFSGNTLDAEDVFISTSEPIDPREVDQEYDIYDVRRGGGFPLPPEPPQCDALGDGCQGNGGGTPTTGNVISDDAGGGGNVETGNRLELSIARPGARALRRATRAGVLRVRVSASGAGAVRVNAMARIAGKTRKVGSARIRMSRAGTRTVTVRLGSGALRQLAKRGRLKVRLSVAMPDARTRSLTVRLTERRSR